MNVQTVTVTVNLEEMESQLQTLQKERVRVEESLDSLRRQKSEKDDEARPLKKLLAAGDKSASAKLDRIDAEVRDFVRREDSLRADEAQLSPKIVSLQKLVNETRRIRVDEERSRQFDADCDEADKATKEFLAAFAVATEKAARMSISSGTLLANWGQEGASANERLVLRPLGPVGNPDHALRMAGWKVPVNSGYARQVVIVGMLPPAKKSSSNGHGK
jgi:septal ring factor EnvC (AmiA/AmiB activator)